MIEKGFKNVKTVYEGGWEMEKYFEYYRGGRVINPLTGTVIVVKP